MKNTLLIILAVVAILSYQGTAAGQELENGVIRLNLSPSVIEAVEGTYPIGYVSLTQNNGEAINAPQELEIKLKSSSDNLSIPESVKIKQNQNYASFDITINEAVDEEIEISATLQDQTSTQKLRVGEVIGELSFTPVLLINMASDNSHVNSLVPFSVYLQTVDGTIVQAPKDIDIVFEYDDDLIKPQSDKITIEKGEFYAISYVRTFENIGRAFIKANAPELNIDSVASLKISSTDPNSLQIFVYPERVPEQIESDFDIFVGLYDSNGDPAIATEDVNLSIFADRGEFLADMLDDLWEGYGPVIKRGAFGIHAKVDTDFVFPTNPFNYTITASSDNYGSSSDLLQIVKQLSHNDPKADLKAMNIFVPDKLPSKATAIMSYQASAIEIDEDTEDDDPALEGFDEEEDTIRVIDHLEEDELFPITTDKVYQTRKNSINLATDNLRITTTDDSIVRVIDPGVVKDGRTHGTAIIATGQKTGEVTLTATLKGLATGSAKTTVVNPLMAVDTKIFSPFGEDKLIFNNKGFADILFVIMDASNRPTTLANGVEYVVKPVNKLVEIGEKETFAVLPIHSSSFGASTTFEEEILENNQPTGEVVIKTSIDVTPIGIKEEQELKKITDIEIQPSPTTVQLSFPTNQILTNGTSVSEPLASVQLLDIFGNPVTVIRNLTLELESSDETIIQTPPYATIPEGTSFTKVPITLTGNEGVSDISVSATGIKYGSTEEIQVTQSLTKLSIFAPIAEQMEMNQGYTLEFFVDDEFGNTIPDASMSFVAEDGTAVPEFDDSDSSGRVEVTFTPTGPNPTLTAIAFKENYVDDEETVVFDVTIEEEQGENTILGLPPLIVYGAAGGAAAGIGVVVMMLLRKPKTEEEEEEEMEI